MERIRIKANNTPKGKWIEGYGYDDTLLEEQGHPTRFELDKVAPKHPVLITHISSHLAIANSKAFKLAEIDKNISNPQGGHFGRDHNGLLDGMLHEIPDILDLFLNKAKKRAFLSNGIHMPFFKIRHKVSVLIDENNQISYAIF